MTERNDFSNNSNNKKEKNVIDSPIKQSNKENARKHRPKSKSFLQINDLNQIKYKKYQINMN